MKMSPLILQAGCCLVMSGGFAVRGFLAQEGAAWIVAFLALLFALIALYSEFELNTDDE